MDSLTKLMKQKVTDYAENKVDMKKLDDNVSTMIDFAKQIGEENEDGSYTVWARDIVGSQHGQYKYAFFLNEVLGTEYEANSVAVEDYIIRYQEQVADMLALELNKRSRLQGTYSIEEHEANGSLGILYTERG